MVHMSTPRESDSVIRGLLIDDHEIFLAALRSLLQREPGFLVIGEARNRTEALEAARQHPNIILLDLVLDSGSGTDLMQDLIKTAEGARIIVLTGVADPDLHLCAVCLGAMGVVHKLEAPELLLKAIRRVYSGEAWLKRTMVASAMTQLQGQHRKPDPIAANIDTLTPRELEVIAALGEGLRNKGIGERLFLAEKTVRHYLSSIFDKLQVSDRLELMIFAYQHGLAKVPSLPNSPTPALKP